jgi:ferritin-like metal-binding protein YciE
VELNSLSDVLVNVLADLYSAEEQLVEALPKMAAAAHSYDLRNTLESHLEETRTHVDRLQQVFTDIGLDAVPTQTSKAMKGLIQEGAEIIRAHGDAVAIDAALIGAAQAIEHYEIACYGTARALAGEYDLGTASSLLDQTLEEESKADKALTKLASGGLMSSGINRVAAMRSVGDDADSDTDA